MLSCLRRVNKPKVKDLRANRLRTPEATARQSDKLPAL
jgi:hypothetical protein